MTLDLYNDLLEDKKPLKEWLSARKCYHNIHRGEPQPFTVRIVMTAKGAETEVPDAVKEYATGRVKAAMANASFQFSASLVGPRIKMNVGHAEDGTAAVEVIGTCMMVGEAFPPPTHSRTRVFLTYVFRAKWYHCKTYWRARRIIRRMLASLVEEGQ